MHLRTCYVRKAPLHILELLCCQGIGTVYSCYNGNHKFVLSPKKTKLIFQDLFTFRLSDISQLTWCLFKDDIMSTHVCVGIKATNNAMNIRCGH